VAKKGTSRRAGPESFPDTRSSVTSTPWARAPDASPSATVWAAFPGCGYVLSMPVCRRGHENLCLAPRFTGWDEDGGFAEQCVVDEAFAYRLSLRYDDQHAAPLLCSGIIGYRALRLASLTPAGALGIYGFGASAHLTAQLALKQGARVHVLTRSPAAKALALELGVSSAAGSSDPPPEALDSAILFAPVGELVPAALQALAPGGTV